MAEGERTVQEELALSILLADRLRKSAEEADSFKSECSELAKQVDLISHMLRSVVRLSSSASSASSAPVYERPIRRISADVTKNLEKALSLVRKCKKHGSLLHVFIIITAADFRKASNYLDSSVGDLKWLLKIFDSDGISLSLPPIASNDPILSWVWTYIAAIQMGQLRDRVDAANELSSLARDNERTKKIIVEEGGVQPLLKLLKEGVSPEAQIASANALFNLVTDRERVGEVVVGIPAIVQVLCDSSTKVQIMLAKLVARMADLDPVAQEEFARVNVTRPLISLVSMDMVLEDPKLLGSKTSIHSIVQINKELVGSNNHGHYLGRSLTDGSTRGNGSLKKGRDLETPEMKMQLKVSCAEALWKLSRGNLLNSRKITETKGLLCLGKLIGQAKDELQMNSLFTVMEIAGVAEFNSELRRSAFKTSSPAAKVVLDQLLRVVSEDCSPKLQIPAIKAIGYLARTFPARETRMIGPLVTHLGNENVDVAIESALALSKFVSPENFNCVEHSKTIIDFGGVPPVMRLLKCNEGAQLHGLVLLCYLSLHVANSKALEQARALNAIEVAARSIAVQHPHLRDLIARAVHHLNLYQAGVVHHQRQN